MASCPFCARIEQGDQLIATSRHAVVIPDGFPVADGHTLVVPRRHVERPEALGEDEWMDLFALVRQSVGEVVSLPGVAGVNVGFNSGHAAGQTIDHAHVHVIPRRPGDTPDPRGGVRWVLPDRADYWSAR